MTSALPARPARSTFPARRLSRLTAALGLTGALVLTACDAGSQAEGESVTIGIAAAPANLDFTTQGGAAIFEALLGNVYEGLVRLDQDGEIQPLLAEAWEVSDDGLEYSFTLREGVSFHDGTPFDAEIVQFSLERLDEWTVNTPGNLGAIERVDVVSELEVAVVLSEPDYDVLFWLAGPLGAMFSPDSLDSLATEANGTGPFTFGEYQEAVRMTLLRNEDYWGDPAEVGEAAFAYYADAAAAANALRSGGVDALLRAEAYDQIGSFESDEDFDVAVGTSPGVVVMTLNAANEALSDVEVRRAITAAVDKEAVLAAATGGYGTILGGPSVPTDPYFTDFTGEIPFDPDAAAEALEEAGVAGASLRFTVPDRPYAEAAAQVIQDNLTSAGLDVTLAIQEFPAVWVEQTMTNQDFDLTIVNHVEPRNVVNYAHSDYYWGFDDAETAASFTRAAEATDDDEHQAAMAAATERIVSEAPGVWLYNPPHVVIARSGLEGLPENDLGVGMELARVTVSE
ncbi:peptide/nickel transport system substrate-binding protein [Bogoriella caseilytica]|uniref:Peptide/nickel transport system substrate-binding protein n=1 Tax=Bogoriella caseilytica TaxID=56055 RepID=A0A3N2BCJ8_9MICO|nr:peptide/nickel transport system substrate-binding protein [Bogoriella caseilytica]